MDNTLIKLIEIEKRIWKLSDELEKISECLEKTDFTDKILDLVGVPADNTLTKDYSDPDYFCRDGYTDIIWCGIENGKSPKEILEELKKEVKRLKT